MPTRCPSCKAHPSHTRFSPVPVSKSKIVIFGGATGDTGKYIITGDTYALDLISSKWSKLEGKYLRTVMYPSSLIRCHWQLAHRATN